MTLYGQLEPPSSVPPPVRPAGNVPTPGQVFGDQANMVCRVRVAGGLVYDSRRMPQRDAETMAEQVFDAMEAPHRQPVFRFDAAGYPALGIATRSITTTEVVSAETPVCAPVARTGGGRR